MGYLPCQLVQDFSHQRYQSQVSHNFGNHLRKHRNLFWRRYWSMRKWMTVKQYKKVRSPNSWSHHIRKKNGALDGIFGSFQIQKLPAPESLRNVTLSGSPWSCSAAVYPRWQPGSFRCASIKNHRQRHTRLARNFDSTPWFETQNIGWKSRLISSWHMWLKKMKPSFLFGMLTFYSPLFRFLFCQSSPSQNKKQKTTNAQTKTSIISSIYYMDLLVSFNIYSYIKGNNNNNNNRRVFFSEDPFQYVLSS